jgi:protease IV
VDAFYDSFITEVAASRKIDKAKVHTVAQGRVWIASDAKERGLVDTLGGLTEAIASARKRSGVTEDAQVVLYGSPRGLFAGMGGEEGVRSEGEWVETATDAVAAAPAPVEVPEAVKAIVRELGIPMGAVESPGIQFVMPYRVEIR